MFRILLPLTCCRWVSQRPLAVTRMDLRCPSNERSGVWARLCPRGLPLLVWCFSATQWRCTTVVAMTGRSPDIHFIQLQLMITEWFWPLENLSLFIAPQSDHKCSLIFLWNVSMPFPVIFVSLADYWQISCDLDLIFISLWGNMCQIDQRDEKWFFSIS